jgi:hypothetical protein
MSKGIHMHIIANLEFGQKRSTVKYNKRFIGLLTVKAIICFLLLANLESNLYARQAFSFGQKIEGAEKSLNTKASPTPFPPLMNRGKIDQTIDTNDFRLDFDSGYLYSITLKQPCRFQSYGLAPYLEKWKNFDSIDNFQVESNMNRDDFLHYLSLWENRAKALSIQKMPEGDLRDRQYSVSFYTSDIDGLVRIHIEMGPTRRASNEDGVWGDGWTVFFAKRLDTSSGQNPIQLDSVKSSCDKYSTRGRTLPAGK